MSKRKRQAAGSSKVRVLRPSELESLKGGAQPGPAPSPAPATTVPSMPKD